MKAVLISIHPKWCEKIASGEKTIEVRKNRPRLETPFKVYIYCTTDRGKSFLTKSHCTNELYTTKKRWLAALEKRGNVTYSGKVICEFVCDEIIECRMSDDYSIYDVSDDEIVDSCLSLDDLWEYGKGKTLYGWHISDLVIYDKPKELSNFVKSYILSYDDWLYGIYNGKGGAKSSYESYKQVFIMKKPPQSWCYVKELESE